MSPVCLPERLLSAGERSAAPYHGGIPNWTSDREIITCFYLQLTTILKSDAKRRRLRWSNRPAEI